MYLERVSSALGLRLRFKVQFFHDLHHEKMRFELIKQSKPVKPASFGRKP